MIIGKVEHGGYGFSSSSDNVGGFSTWFPIVPLVMHDKEIANYLAHSIST